MTGLKITDPAIPDITAIALEDVFELVDKSVTTDGPAGSTRRGSFTQVKALISPAATEAVVGISQFATNAQTVTGTATDLATHPAGVAAAIADAVSGVTAAATTAATAAAIAALDPDIDALDARIDAIEEGGVVTSVTSFSTIESTVIGINTDATIVTATTTAGILEPGDVVLFHGEWNVNNDSAASTDFIYKFKIAGSTIATSGTMAYGDTATGSSFFQILDIAVTVLTSTTARLSVSMVGSEQGAPGTMPKASANKALCYNSESIAINTASTQAYAWTFQTSASHATIDVVPLACSMTYIKAS